MCSGSTSRLHRTGIYTTRGAAQISSSVDSTTHRPSTAIRYSQRACAVVFYIISLTRPTNRFFQPNLPFTSSHSFLIGLFRPALSSAGDGGHSQKIRNYGNGYVASEVGNGVIHGLCRGTRVAVTTLQNLGTTLKMREWGIWTTKGLELTLELLRWYWATSPRSPSRCPPPMISTTPTVQAYTNSALCLPTPTPRLTTKPFSLQTGFCILVFSAPPTAFPICRRGKLPVTAQ